MGLEPVWTLLVVFNAAHAHTALPAECSLDGHSVLQSPYRSPAFSSSWLQGSSPQDLICDRALAPGWYRFQMFDKPASMPTECVEVNHCGTQAPVWLALGEGESLPRPLEVRQLTACAAWQSFASGSRDCCMFRIPVSVRNCGGFYVYLLQPTQGCMGYCAQEMPDAPPTPSPTCGPDEANAAGTCREKQPPTPTVPAIVPEATGNGVHLRCSFASSSSSSLGYVVSWSRLSSGGRKEELKQETTVQTSAFIELDGFNLRLGDKIYCSSSSFFLDSPDVVGASAESPEFFVGIKIRPEVSSVPEDGRMYELLFESTIPVPCPDESSSSTERCSLSLQLSTSSTDEGFLGADLSLSSCVVDLDRGPCRDGVCSRALIHFGAVTDFVKDGNRTTKISVKSIQTLDFLWNGYSPEPVEVTVADVPSAYCYVFTDPHILTFDGRRYENFQVGTFVLYKSRFWPLEVQVRQRECGSAPHAASCVCGFVARDGGDVVAFDMCGGDVGETKPRLSVKSRDLSQSGVRITESYQGRKVTISFSSGAFVRADVSDWGMSLTLRAPGSDRGQTEGLCGTYDGLPANDLHSAGGATLEKLRSFLSEWRLPPGGSMFDTVPPRRGTVNPRMYCTCQAGPRLAPPRARSPPATSSDSSCSHHAGVRLSGVLPALDVTAEYIDSVELPTEGHARRSARRGGRDAPRRGRSRRRNHRYIPNSPRQSLSQADLEGSSYFFPEDHEAAVRPDSPPTWPTPSGLTPRRAGTLCRRAVANSSIASGCRRLLEEATVSHATAMCVSDLRLKDEPSWLKATLPLLENECERRLVEERRRAEEYPDVLDVLRCPALCHWNGRCSERGCVCFPGFGSYDCSVLSDRTPEIAELQEEGLCDVQQGGCGAVHVHGRGFEDSFELKCEFVREKFLDGEWVLDKPQFVLAVFLNATALECRLPLEARRVPADLDVEPATNRPPLGRWQMKVTNDGYSYSNAKILTVYDGACQICSLDTEVLCALREKTCSIGGQCYSEGGSHPSSPCLACLPDSSKHSWSVVEKNEPPVLQSMPSHLRSFQAERFIYQLRARDPEGHAVLFALEAGPDGASLTPDGLLTWKATADAAGTHTLRFTARDECDAETRASIQVSVGSCECLNGASCVADPTSPPGSGGYLCACPDGFAGGRCEANIDDCRPNPCRLGRCIDGIDAFSCVCPPGMTGRGHPGAFRVLPGPTCREDVDECVSRPCFPGVGCSNTPGSFVCGVCPRGFRGDGKGCACNFFVKDAMSPSGVPPSGPAPCSGRRCHPGVQCFESVHVSAGFVCGPCPPGLHGDGQTCAATGQGSLARGADGHDISKALSPTSSSSPRRPRGRTAKPKTTVSGKSTAAPRDQISAGAFDPGCADSPCFPGVPCEPTVPGSFRCGRCPDGYHGDGVSCRAVCRRPCGRNAACTLPNTCTCEEGYTGHSCHIAVCRPDCRNQGRCVEPGVCGCPAGYGGPTCEEARCEPPCRNGGSCLTRDRCTCRYGYVGPRCEIMVCNRHCEHGGECLSPDVCRCKPGWYGPTCNSAVCSPVCLNGGRCTKPDVCACPGGFYGARCQIAVCSPPCKNGGQCRRNNVCSCPEGHTGRRCQRSVCEPVCMNRGKCVGPDSCSCASGWRGRRCNIPVCLQKCKNGGECLGPNTCHCPAGWEGLQCQTAVCRQRCVNGGRCVLPEYCHCRKGFTGLTCAVKASIGSHTCVASCLKQGGGAKESFSLIVNC
ncbi:von Willebrand factor D and EGF domain-containing protein [Brachionichthys hirsutus]|uniref:von Willebrand factor D and EGF domain-containing protein n=1 Tax=Brachionichthys hirsutus TaxID=412623 RepID=UPI003604304B